MDIYRTPRSVLRVQTAQHVFQSAPHFGKTTFVAIPERTLEMRWLGIRDEKHTSPLHSDTFDFDESVLVKGIAAFIAVADAKSI